MFTWIPIHKEAIRKILEYRDSEEGLLNVLREMESKKLRVISLDDRDSAGNTIPLTVIDPFTFLASFNRGITAKNRRDNWRFLKERWKLQSPVPEDFDGIPVVHNLSSWFFPWAGERENNHVEGLWLLTEQAASRKIEQLDEKLFDRCLTLSTIGISKLTIGLFWINPQGFLPADPKTVKYAASRGVTLGPENYHTYREWMRRVSETLGNNYPQISRSACYRRWGRLASVPN